MDQAEREVFYASADRPTLERLAAWHREQVRLIEAQIIKHVPVKTGKKLA
jgi:hypothetical protein